MHGSVEGVLGNWHSYSDSASCLKTPQLVQTATGGYGYQLAALSGNGRVSNTHGFPVRALQLISVAVWVETSAPLP